MKCRIQATRYKDKKIPDWGFLFFFKKSTCIYSRNNILYITLYGVVAQLVRASACHAEGRGFEPRQSRQYLPQFSAVFCLFYGGINQVLKKSPR